jgi:hypothetical protein
MLAAAGAAAFYLRNRAFETLDAAAGVLLAAEETGARAATPAGRRG